MKLKIYQVEPRVTWADNSVEEAKKNYWKFICENNIENKENIKLFIKNTKRVYNKKLEIKINKFKVPKENRIVMPI